MAGSMRTPALILLSLLAVALPPAAGAGAATLPVGISDQNASTFTAPLFAQLGMKHARYVTPWDAALRNDPQLDAWIVAARAAGVQPLISFEKSAGDRCPDRPCSAPSERRFTKAFKAFRAKYPDITTISPWNEVNHKTQPTYRDPVIAARYFHIVKRSCAGCTVVAADLLDAGNMKSWVREFARYAKDARLWGLHNYGDTNRFRTSGARNLLETVKGDVWLTETGAIVAFTTSSGLVSFKKNETRAAKAMHYLFDKLVPSSRRIKRVYVYNWLSDPKNRWDSGLVRHDGTKRKLYDIVRAYIRGGARR
jgi:hypothetical protein